MLQEVGVEAIAHDHAHGVARERDGNGLIIQNIADGFDAPFNNGLERKGELVEDILRKAAAAGLIARQVFLFQYQHALPGLAEEEGRAASSRAAANNEGVVGVCHPVFLRWSFIFKPGIILTRISQRRNFLRRKVAKWMGSFFLTTEIAEFAGKNKGISLRS